MFQVFMIFRINLKLLFGVFYVLISLMQVSLVLPNIFLAFCSPGEIAPEVSEYNYWLSVLNQELENQGISLPERY